MADPHTTPDPVPPPQRAGRGWGWIIGLIALVAILWLVFQMWDGGDEAVVDTPAAEELIGDRPLNDPDDAVPELEDPLNTPPEPEMESEPVTEPDPESGAAAVEPGTGAGLER